MTGHRSEPAQQGPPEVATLRNHLPHVTPIGNLFREHGLREGSPDGGCRWFSSSGEGRFDLTDPLGSCYLGETEGVAARERCGRLMAMGIAITEALYAGRVVSEVPPPDLDGPVADLTHPSALRAGVTGELASSADYALCQEWAQACWDAGFEGLRYAPRFTPGGGERGYALFDEAGAHPARAVVGRRSLFEVLSDLDYPTVRADALTLDTLQLNDGAEPRQS